MPWYVPALGSAFVFAAQELLMRVLAIKSTTPRIFSIVFNIWGALFAIIAFLIQDGSFTQLTRIDTSQRLLIISAIILYGLYERYQFSARKRVDASTLSVIYRLSTVMSFAGSIVLLAEPLTMAKAIGATLIIGGSFLLVYKNPKLRLSRELGYPLLCAILLGFGAIADKPASANLSPALYSFLVWCVPIGIIAFPKIRLDQLTHEFRIGGWKVALAAILNVTGYILYLQAFALADASRVIPVISITGILVVIGGIIILGEHDHLWRKIAAGVLAFAGVILLR